MKYLISYDIQDNRCRNKVSKILKRYAFRVQKSVFEGYFDSKTLADCLKRLEASIDHSNDSVRWYALCSDCAKKIIYQGINRKIEKQPYMIL